MNPTNPTNPAPPQLPPKPYPPQAPLSQAVQPGAAPVDEAVKVFIVAEAFVLAVSKLGAIIIGLLIIKIFAINGGNFDNGVQAITSIIGLAAVLAIYAWSTDFMIRYKAIKRLKSKSISTFLTVYYAIAIFIIPWVSSVFNPLVKTDQDPSIDIRIVPLIFYILFSSTLSVGAELLIYMQINKSGKDVTPPSGLSQK